MSSMSGERCSSAPFQKTRPMTAARWSSVLPCGERWSMRAAMSACSVSGTRAGPPLPAPLSTSMRIVSSTNSGLPSVRSRSSAGRGGGISPEVPASWKTSFSTRSSLSSAESGSSSIAVERTRPPPQPGRVSRSSGRARQRIRSGVRTQSARCSMRSRSGSSAQWMSSKKSTSGWTSPSVCITSRAAQEISCALRSPSSASSIPEARPRTSATVSSSQQALSFANASSSGSSSEMPAAALTISASGQ